MNVYIMKTISVILLLILCNFTYANNVGTETVLELPRFVSLKSNDSNIRVGPSMNYPILLKYITYDFPLKVVEEYEDWRKIIDFDDNTGWIHKSLIKGERTGIILSSDYNKIKMYNTISGRMIGEIEVGSIVVIPKCKTNWCFIKIKDHKGWINKKFIWGVEKKEIYNIGFFQVMIDYYLNSINFLEKYISQ